MRYTQSIPATANHVPHAILQSLLMPFYCVARKKRPFHHQVRARRPSLDSWAADQVPFRAYFATLYSRGAEAQCTRRLDNPSMDFPLSRTSIIPVETFSKRLWSLILARSGNVPLSSTFRTTSPGRREARSGPYPSPADSGRLAWLVRPVRPRDVLRPNRRVQCLAAIAVSRLILYFAASVLFARDHRTEKRSRLAFRCLYRSWSQSSASCRGHAIAVSASLGLLDFCATRTHSQLGRASVIDHPDPQSSG